jgi:hypothetical protein
MLSPLSGAPFEFRAAGPFLEMIDNVGQWAPAVCGDQTAGVKPRNLLGSELDQTVKCRLLD